MESIAEIEERHEQELKELREKVKAMLKGAKKSAKAQIEAEAIQMEFDLKAKHREELEEAEERGVPAETAEPKQSIPKEDDLEEKKRAEEIQIAQKKEKAKKKQDKRNQKEKDRQETKSQIQTAMSNVETQRDREIKALKEKLEREKLQIRDIPSDGNCLYRAVADQLEITSLHDHSKDKKGEVSSHIPDFKELRILAAEYIKSNANEFAPFLGFSPEDAEFDNYCDRVASDTLAEWGGQLEIRALSERLEKPIFVYSATSPILKTGEEFESKATPLRISFHQHLYALGEHYNSLIPNCC